MASKTREKLIEVARQLFAIKGVSHTTMNDIASASSKGRRTIYTYFKNKKEIYNAVLEEESDRMVDSLREIVGSAEPVDVRLGQFLRKRLQRFVAPTQQASFKSWISFDTRRLNRIQSLVREKEEAMMKSLLREGIETGVFRKDRCEMMMDFMPFAVAAVDSHVLETESEGGRSKALNSFVKYIISDIRTENAAKQ